MSDWQKDLTDELESYTDDVTEGVKSAVKTVADKTVDALKKTSPKKIKGKKKGKYAKGWRVETMTDNPACREAVIHNKTDYQLTHLLEHGHQNVNGSFTAARPHIAAAEEMATSEFTNMVEVVIKGDAKRYK